MNKILTTTAILAIGILIGAILAASYTIIAQPRPKLVVAVQPTLAAADVLAKAQPLKSFLEQHLHIDVEIYVPTSYAAVVESIRRGHVDVALMGAWPAYLAWKLGNAEVVLAEVRRVGQGMDLIEGTFYYSYWVVLPNSPINSIEDLKGKTVAMPSPISTSGYVAPLAKLVEKGLIQVEKGKEADPNTFFKVVFTGGYAQSWMALRNGDVDAAVIAGDIPADLYFEVMSNTRVIDFQGPIPSHAVVVSKNLQEPLRSKVVEAFIRLGDEKPELMKNFISALFVRFQPTTSQEHLSSLDRYLSLTNLKYTERVG